MKLMLRPGEEANEHSGKEQHEEDENKKNLVESGEWFM